MRPYETLIALSNELGEGQRAVIERLHGVIESGGGTLDSSLDWGVRPLAYPIKRQNEAHFYLLEYQAEPPVVQEIERTLRITDGVLRYITVQQEHTGLPDVKGAGGRAETPLHEVTAQPAAARETPEPKPAAGGEQTDGGERTTAGAQGDAETTEVKEDE